jgi:hypothetical protein
VPFEGARGDCVPRSTDLARASVLNLSLLGMAAPTATGLIEPIMGAHSRTYPPDLAVEDGVFGRYSARYSARHPNYGVISGES